MNNLIFLLFAINVTESLPDSVFLTLVDSLNEYTGYYTDSVSHLFFKSYPNWIAKTTWYRESNNGAARIIGTRATKEVFKYISKEYKEPIVDQIGLPYLLYRELKYVVKSPKQRKLPKYKRFIGLIYFPYLFNKQSSKEVLGLQLLYRDYYDYFYSVGDEILKKDVYKGLKGILDEAVEYYLQLPPHISPFILIRNLIIPDMYVPSFLFGYRSAVSDEFTYGFGFEMSFHLFDIATTSTFVSLNLLVWDPWSAVQRDYVLKPTFKLRTPPFIITGLNPNLNIVDYFEFSIGTELSSVDDDIPVTYDLGVIIQVGPLLSVNITYTNRNAVEFGYVSMGVGLTVPYYW